MIDIGGTRSSADDGEDGERSHAPRDPRPGPASRWAVNLGYAILLIIMATVPSTSRIAKFSMPDWFAHAFAYGIQSALLFWACLPSLRRCRALGVGVLGAFTFGMVTEALQLLQPARTLELKDIAANGVGALLVCGAIAGLGWFGDRRGV